MGGWIPRGQLPHLDAMDTSAGRTRGRLVGSEEIDYHKPPIRLEEDSYNEEEGEDILDKT